MISKDDPKRKDLCENVVEKVKEQDIKFIYLQFTDIHGIIKSFEIIVSKFFNILIKKLLGTGFDALIIVYYYILKIQIQASTDCDFKMPIKLSVTADIITSLN